MPTDHPWLEMTEEPTVRNIPERGREVLKGWLQTLAGADPKVVPHYTELQEINDMIKDNVKHGEVGLPVSLLPKPSTMRMACQRFIAVTNPETSERPHSCPFLAGEHLVSAHTAVEA